MIFRGKVMRATEMFSIVKLPLVVGKRGPRLRFPWRPMHCRGEPAVSVDAPVACHLEVLRGVA